MYLLFYYFYKKLKLDKLPLIRKFIGLIESNVIYRIWKNIIQKHYNYNLNEYLLITSTRVGCFMYNDYPMRILRFLGFFSILIMVYVPIVIDLWMRIHGQTYFLELLVSPKAIVIYMTCGFFGWVLNVLYWIFLFVMRLYYYRELICDNYFNFMLYWLKIFTIILVVFLFSGCAFLVFDYSFEKIGLVPPFLSLFGDGKFFTGDYITPGMGCEPSKGLFVLKGDEFPGAYFIQYMQNKTLQMEERLHLEFLEQEIKK